MAETAFVSDVVASVREIVRFAALDASFARELFHERTF